MEAERERTTKEQRLSEEMLQQLREVVEAERGRMAEALRQAKSEAQVVLSTT